MTTAPARTTVYKPYGESFLHWAGNRPDVVCLSGDLTASCEVDRFRDVHPERFLSMGMAEQNMIGVAGGLARAGFVPFVHTFAVFATRRPFDQLGMSVAYPNLPVRIMGFLPGLTTPGGVTHQAIDDVSLMRTLPNMTVLECGDATEVEAILEVTEQVEGPVYARLLRGDVPRLFHTPMELGAPRMLCEGSDVCVISSGVASQIALPAVKEMLDAGASLTHVHISTIKPFPSAAVVAAVESCRFGAVAIENHSVIGGLGAAVAEAVVGAGIGRRLIRLGLQDTYAHGGSSDYLFSHYGLAGDDLIRAVERLLDAPLELSNRAARGALGTSVGDENRSEAL